MAYLSDKYKTGAIKAIFYSEFHPTLGPKISCQVFHGKLSLNNSFSINVGSSIFKVPEDYVSKEIFDAVSVYIIPKEQLDSCIITVNVLGHKITGIQFILSVSVMLGKCQYSIQN